VSLIFLTPFISSAEDASVTPIIPTYRPPALVTVNEKGEASLKNAVVFFITGKALYTRTYWGDSYVRWTIRTSERTDIIKKFGGQTDFSSIKVGDIINVEGTLAAGSDTLNIDSTMIRDLSQEMEKAGFSGKISGVDVPNGIFVMSTDSGKKVTVKTNSNTVIKKGVIYITLSKLNTGDTINFVDGVYHEPSQTITANNVDVFQTKTIFQPRNFEGKLKSLSGLELPITMVVTVAGVDYNFYLNEKASVLTAKRLAAKLQRFVLGDTVRLYGKIRETNLSEVDAEIVRNLDL
jgi:hypothetical protein